ncbi:putative FCP1 homology domain-containing protein [Erysiphe neolycopersici]|uniref:Mitochondrial import inner membrane translocase subunit TIM50 n=1 Tax=Erysiphe neolycopersici TaxID=212602 RepID=A0A420HZX2_9PEZI|nr:putative FCP1 homology domain-containing protein [Erysiphe neolycopersici]
MLKLSNSSWYLTQIISNKSNTPKISLRYAFRKVESSFPLRLARWLYLTAKGPRFLDHYESLIKSRGVCPNNIFMNKSILKISQWPEKNRKVQDKQSSNKAYSSKVPTKKRSERLEPSTGKPSFTDAYMQNSCEKIRRLEKPQHLLVILDLNGTLLYRPNRSKRSTHVTPRPYSFEFLRDCTDKFAVVIWSSARPVNVRSICDNMLSPNLQNKILAIWARDKFDLSNQDYNLRVTCYKRLTKLWDDKTISMSHPEYSQGARWDQTNTVLIDDSIEKARTEPYNLIKIPEFLGDPNEPGDVLLQVYGFLNHVSMFSNVSAYLRQHPFTLSSS